MLIASQHSTNAAKRGCVDFAHGVICSHRSRVPIKSHACNSVQMNTMSLMPVIPKPNTKFLPAMLSERGRLGRNYSSREAKSGGDIKTMCALQQSYDSLSFVVVVVHTEFCFIQ